MSDRIVIPPKNQPHTITVAELKETLDAALAAGLDPTAAVVVDDGLLVVNTYGAEQGRWQSDNRPFFALHTETGTGRRVR